VIVNSQLITLILIRCGLRISSAVGLPFDCTITDADGAPYLRYYNTKMKREALVPVDDEILALIGEQKQRALRRFPDGTPVLFPGQTATSAGAGHSPAIPTAVRSTACWKTATSATSTASPSA
jgi:integrase